MNMLPVKPLLFSLGMALVSSSASAAVTCLMPSGVTITLQTSDQCPPDATQIDAQGAVIRPPIAVAPATPRAEPSRQPTARPAPTRPRPAPTPEPPPSTGSAWEYFWKIFPFAFLAWLAYKVVTTIKSQSARLYCTRCGHDGKGLLATPGSLLIEIVLWLCMIVPGLIYSLWRHSGRYMVCAKCGARTLIPLNSPNARAAMRSLSPSPPEPAAPPLEKPDDRREKARAAWVNLLEPDGASAPAPSPHSQPAPAPQSQLLTSIRVGDATIEVRGRGTAPEPQHTPPDKDAWETWDDDAFGAYANGAPLKVPLKITYRDLGGQITQRDIDTLRYAHNGSDGNLEAYCHLRAQRRTFRLSRILEAVNLSTGEVIHDLPTWLDAQYEASDEGQVDAFENEHDAALTALFYIAKAGGQFRPQKKRAIMDLCEEFGLIDPTQLDLLITHMAGWHVPSAIAYGKALREQLAPMPEDYLRQVYNAAQRIVGEKSTPHPDEARALARMRKELDMPEIPE